jgi:hypothetical protein
VDVRVSHGLATRLAHVETNVEAIGPTLGEKSLPNGRDEPPDVGLVLGRERKEVRHVPARNDERVVGVQRESIGDGDNCAALLEGLTRARKQPQWISVDSWWLPSVRWHDEVRRGVTMALTPITTGRVAASLAAIACLVHASAANCDEPRAVRPPADGGVALTQDPSNKPDQASTIFPDARGWECERFPEAGPVVQIGDSKKWQAFFEPGKAMPIDFSEYLGVVVIWTHSNGAERLILCEAPASGKELLLEYGVEAPESGVFGTDDFRDRCTAWRIRRPAGKKVKVRAARNETLPKDCGPIR